MSLNESLFILDEIWAEKWEDTVTEKFVILKQFHFNDLQGQGVSVCVLLATLEGAVRSLKGKKVRKSVFNVIFHAHLLAKTWQIMSFSL